MRFTIPFTPYSIPEMRWSYLAPVMLITYLLGVRFLLIFSYNIDLDGAEFTFVHYIQQLLSGKPLYMDPENYPYSAVIYTPAYLYLVYGFCKIFSVDYIQDIYHIYIAGRIISLLFVLLSLVYVDKFSRRWTPSLLTRLYVLCIFLILFTGHAYAVRPDSMKICFFILFLYYYTGYYYYEAGNRVLALSIFFALLSISAKQDAIIYIFLVQGVHMLTSKKVHVAVTLAASTLIFAFYFLLLQLFFGNYCLVSLFPFNLQTISNYQDSYNLYVVIFNGIRLLPLYLVLFYNLRKFKNSSKYPLIQLISFSGILAGISTTLFLFRPGSYLNYSFELMVLLIVGFIILLSSQTHGRAFKISFVAYFILIFLSNILLKNSIFNLEKEKAYKTTYNEYYSLRTSLLPLLEDQEKIFSPDLQLSIFLADKNVVYGHEYHIDRLIFAHLGLKTTSKLLLNSSQAYDQKFLNGEIKYVIAFNQKNVRTLMASTYSHYKLIRNTGQFSLYQYAE